MTARAGAPQGASGPTADDLRHLASIRERLGKATKGPWVRADDEKFYRRDAIKCLSPLAEGLGERILVSANHHFEYEADLDFIAHAPDDVAFLLARIAPPTGAGGGATAPDSREGMDAQPGQVVIVRSVVEYVYTARRCSGQMPCDLAEWTHECNNWLLFDQDDGGYHAEVADEDFQRDFAPAPSLSPTPEGASAEPDQRPHEEKMRDVQAYVSAGGAWPPAAEPGGGAAEVWPACPACGGEDLHDEARASRACEAFRLRWVTIGGAPPSTVGRAR